MTNYLKTVFENMTRAGAIVIGAIVIGAIVIGAIVIANPAAIAGDPFGYCAAIMILAFFAFWGMIGLVNVGDEES